MSTDVDRLKAGFAASEAARAAKKKAKHPPVQVDISGLDRPPYDTNVAARLAEFEKRRDAAQAKATADSKALEELRAKQADEAAKHYS
jgi:hypothetical protein